MNGRGSALLAAALIASAVLVHAAPSTHLAETLERDVYVMGTRCRLVAVAADRVSALAGLDTMVRSLEATDAELTTWRPSAFGALADPSDTARPLGRLCALVGELARSNTDTGGAFDPAVGPLLDAWGIGRVARIPSPADVDAARRRSRFARLGFDAEACTVHPAPGMRLDSGAFGKGEAIDRLGRALDGARVFWLADLGGQVGVGGPAGDTHGWDVGIADAHNRWREVARIRLESGSLSTSGGSERDVRVGRHRVGHILDPATGRPARFTGAVSVWHERALVADMLSTALYVMGPARGLAWADVRGVAACFQLEPATPPELRRMRPSRAFAQRFPGACR